MSDDRVTAPFGRRTLTLTGRERRGVYVVLRAADPDGPRPQAGQFYMLSSAERWGGGEGERPFLPRAFSVLRAMLPAGDASLELQFLVQDFGPGSRRLCELDAGDGLAVVGPLGRGFRSPREGRAPLLVGGGVGIAPLAIWQDELLAIRSGPDTGSMAPLVLLGFRDGAHAPGAELLHDPRICTDDGSVGSQALVTDLVGAELDRDPHREVYACGPPPMLEAVRSICAEREVPAQLALESGMACGYGACFGCVIATRRGYVRLCVEGPVLDAELLESATHAAPLPTDGLIPSGR